MAEYFSGKPGGAAKFMRFFLARLILFGSKFVMPGAINFALGDPLLFTEPLHGIAAFIVVVVAILAAEEIAVGVSGFEDFRAVHPRLEHTDILDLVGLHLARIPVEDNEVGQLAGFEAADLVFGKELPRGF